MLTIGGWLLSSSPLSASGGMGSPGTLGFYIMALILVISIYLMVLTGVWIYQKILKPIWRDYIWRNHDYRFWRAWAVILGVIAPALALMLLLVLWRASFELRSQHNLYYQMWKSGNRAYEPEVAMAGLYFDREYLRSLVGRSEKEIFQMFPNTFYEVKMLPGRLVEGQHWYGLDYRRAVVGEVDGWLLVIENGRVIRFDYTKG